MTTMEQFRDQPFTDACLEPGPAAVVSPLIPLPVLRLHICHGPRRCGAQGTYAVAVAHLVFLYGRELIHRFAEAIPAPLGLHVDHVIVRRDLQVPRSWHRHPETCVYGIGSRSPGDFSLVYD